MKCKIPLLSGILEVNISLVLQSMEEFVNIPNILI